MNKARIAKRKRSRSKKSKVLWITSLSALGAVIGEVAYQAAKK